jgi:hypothetical protein
MAQPPSKQYQRRWQRRSFFCISHVFNVLCIDTGKSKGARRERSEWSCLDAGACQTTVQVFRLSSALVVDGGFFKAAFQPLGRSLGLKDR